MVVKNDGRDALAPPPEIDVKKLAYVGFRGAVNTKGERISLEKIVGLIAGRGLLDRTEYIRSARPGSDEQDKAKRALYAVCYGGGFENAQRKSVDSTDIWRPSGLVFVDIDNVDKGNAPPTAGETLIETFRDHPNVVLAYPSASGRGLHVVYRVNPVPDFHSHPDAHGACRADAQGRLPAGFIADPSTSDAGRIAFLAHYADVWDFFRPSAEPLRWTPSGTGLAPAARSRDTSPTTSETGEADIDVWVNLINGAGYDYTLHVDWIRVGLALRHSADDGALGSLSGFDIWEAWSMQNGHGGFWGGREGYAPDDKWREFGDGRRTGRDRITARSILHLAKERGYGGEFPRWDVRELFPETGSTIKLDRQGVEVALNYLGIEIRLNERAQSFEWRTGDRAILANTARGVEPDSWTKFDDTSDAAIRAMIESSFRTQGENKPARFGKERWVDCLHAYCAGVRQVDPLEDWLATLPQWDRVGRIDGLLINLLKADDTPLNRFVAGAIFCGAIDRTYRPGCTHDWIPVLIGEQGVGKSSFVKSLIPPEMQAIWYSDGADWDSSRKEMFESIQGAVVVEFSELAGLHHSRLETLKASIVRTDDKLRLPYRIFASTIPRRWVGIGTANDTDGGVLPGDHSGNRRFVAVEARATQADAEAVRDYLNENREQLWAEALARYGEADRLDRDRNDKEGKAKGNLHILHGKLLESARKVNARYTRRNEGLLGDIMDLTAKYAGTRSRFTLTDLMQQAKLFRDDDERAVKRDKGLQLQFSGLLKEHRWTRKQERDGKGRYWFWYPPPVVDADGSDDSDGVEPAPPRVVEPVASGRWIGRGETRDCATCGLAFYVLQDGNCMGCDDKIKIGR